MNQHLKRALLIITVYLLLTILMTWPTVLHLTDAIPGDGFDGWQNYWNLWWVKEALLVQGTNPFFTDYLYAPTGVSLLFHTLNIFNAWWTLPIQLNFGLAIAYNSVVFVSFALAGYGGYLLSLYTLTRLNLPTRRGLRLAAFVGGLVFTMSPFHMAHLLGHMQVFSMIWPPFYVLWLLRTLEPWSDTPKTGPAAWRNAAIACLFLILATLVDWYHTLYLLLFTGLTLLWTLARRRRYWGNLRRVRLTPTALQPLLLTAAIGAGFAVVMSPLLIPMIRDASQRPDLQTGLAQNVTLSADLLAFVTPQEMHPLWGNWARTIANNFTTTTSERMIFAGYIPLALGLLVVARWRRKQAVIFWAAVTLFFAILALGPFLHVNGKTVTIGGYPLPMPYLLLYETIPFINLTRSLSRYDLMVMMGLGVLTAVSIVNFQCSIFNSQFLSPPRSGKFWQKSPFFLPLILGGLISFEFLVVPYPLSPIQIPDFYRQLAAEPGDFTIAELPMNWDRPTPLLHQTAHGKRLLTAYTSRNNPLELAWRTPVLQHWRYLGPDIIDQPLADIAPTIFYDFNLRYIVLDYWQMPPGPERNKTEQWVSAALPEVAPIYDDGRLKVYRPPDKKCTRPYLSLGNGWSDRQITSAGILRTFAHAADRSAELFMHHPPANGVELRLILASDEVQTIEVWVNGRNTDRIDVSPVFTGYALPVEAGEDELLRITLRVAKPGRPVAVKQVSLRAAPGCVEAAANRD